MAKRVAGKRQGLLYGLIAMIAVAIIFAVLFFIEMNKRQELQQMFDPTAQDLQVVQNRLNDLRSRLATAGVSIKSQALKDQVEALIAENEAYEKSIGTLTAKINEGPKQGSVGETLVSHGTVQGNLSDSAMKQANAALLIAPKIQGLENLALEEKDKPKTLTQAIGLLYTHIDAMNNAYAERQKDIQKAAQNIEALQSTIDANAKNADEKYKQMIASKDAEIAAHRAKVEEVQKQSDNVDRQREAIKNELINFRVAAAEQLQEKINRILEQESQIKELLDKIKRETTGVAQPDGVIVSLMPGERTGYIDLAAGDGVFTNLTFNVYDPSEVTPGKEKGYVKIVNVMDNASEVVITSFRKTDPVVKGDIITNIVYDRTRRFHFAVVGHFDIDGDGKDDSGTIKYLIEKFGGKVDDKLNVRSDYLVVGEDPMSKFRAPTMGGMTGQDKAREDVLKDEQKTYGEATDLAQRFWIPVLSQNRFLTLIGIRPAEEQASN